MDVERTFVSLDREDFADATRRLGHSLLGLALGVGVLTVAALVSGALPLAAPSGAVAAPPITAPLLGSAAVPAGVASAAPATVVVAAPPPVTAVTAPPTVSAPAAAAVPAVVAPAVVPPVIAPAAPKVAIAAYRSGGRRYTGMSAEAGTTVLAPRAATVQVRTYQFLDGDVRIGTNVGSLPFFPYVTLTTADGKLTYRPGAVNSDTELLVEDGDEVAAGTPLFRIVGAGASSWATFYDASVSFTVVVSLVAIPSGADLEAAPFVTTR